VDQQADRRALPQPVSRLDPWHIVNAATDALYDICRAVWNEARRPAASSSAKSSKGARFALWKTPERLTERERAKLAHIQKLNAPISRAYLVKEQLRQSYRTSTDDALELLDSWLKPTRRCRLEPFVKRAGASPTSAQSSKPRCAKTRATLA
jgi:transposase